VQYSPSSYPFSGTFEMFAKQFETDIVTIDFFGELDSILQQIQTDNNLLLN